MQDNTKDLAGRIMRSRMRLLVEHGFYGMLLMHLRIMLSTETERFGTDGVFLYFEPSFLSRISDRELDLVMLHSVTHLAFDHPKRASVLPDKSRAESAADIIVNSYIYEECGCDEKAVTLDGIVLPHKAPDGSEGHEHSLEELYSMLTAKKSAAGGKSSDQQSDNTLYQESECLDGESKKPGKAPGRKNHPRGKSQGCPDDHSKWDKAASDPMNAEQWKKNVSDAAKAIEIQKSSFDHGNTSLLAERLMKDLRKPQTDWKTVLNEFIRQEITDYSFEPPDRRFQDSDFFLPDFNVPEDRIENLLFMADASGSMSDDDITDVLSEVRGALDQFDGKLKGWLGFFDSEVTEPVPFEDVKSLEAIRPRGGGGTRFDIIFDYVRDRMQNEPPVSIILLTDGYADFPDESAARGIPVLWVINNDNVTPPWGRVTRIEKTGI